MQIQPYSIYVDHRPLRIAFVVNPAYDETWFDQIIEYNRGKWGGRFNPIIFSDGKTIDEPWWSFLRRYDPDIVFSTVDPEPELRERIQIFLSALAVEVNKPESPLHISHDSISILPTARTISGVAQPYWRDKAAVILFEIDKGTPDAIRKFIIRNFGALDERLLDVKRSLETCDQIRYKVSDLSSLNESLLQLGKLQTSVVFPSQMCTLPNSLMDADYDKLFADFAVIIGNSPDDLTYFWNRSLGVSRFARMKMSQLWIPEELSGEEAIKPGLTKIMNRLALSTSYDGSPRTHFVTFSLSEDKIKSISSTFSKEIVLSAPATRLHQQRLPDFRRSAAVLIQKQGSELYRGHSSEEHVILGEPEVDQGVMAGQHWMVDVYIQFRPERFTNIHGITYWWQLPRRNSILRQFFNKPARVNGTGMLSVLMARPSSFSAGEDVLVIKLPKDEEVFYNFVCGERFDCIEKSYDKRSQSSPFQYMAPSDKGSYLQGVLSLFPDLLNADHLLGQRYWRNVFAKMSNRSLDRSGPAILELSNSIKKKLTHGEDYKNSAEGPKWLAQKLLKIAKRFVKKEVDLVFEDFLEMAESETRRYNEAHATNKIQFDVSGLRDAISGLIYQNMLLLGIKPKCPRCGDKVWYHIDEAKQRVDCKGCGYNFTLDAQESWHYRLNSLASEAFSEHGLIPVILTLGQLMHDARSSFMFVPNSNVFERIGTEVSDKPMEIDILCIKDGELIIGETKESVGLFEDNDFKKMKHIGKLIRPDKIIFSSMGETKEDRGINKLVKEGIKDLQSELAYLEIDVQWYPLHEWMFEACPP